VTMAELRSVVFLRDRECVAAILDPTHQCADVWGQRHSPTDLDSLTLGHVREHAGGKRRDEPGWCIAQCFQSNASHWESANASLVRAYLEGVRRAA
jgi:hypothetical protein